MRKLLYFSIDHDDEANWPSNEQLKILNIKKLEAARIEYIVGLQSISTLNKVVGFNESFS